MGVDSSGIYWPLACLGQSSFISLAIHEYGIDEDLNKHRIPPFHHAR